MFYWLLVVFGVSPETSLLTLRDAPFLVQRLAFSLSELWHVSLNHNAKVRNFHKQNKLFSILFSIYFKC